MNLTVEALNRAFDYADNLGPDQQIQVALMRRLGIDADVLAFLYRTVAGGDPNTAPGDEDRLATYMLGMITTLLALEPERADFIQRMPMQGERWHGLADDELMDVFAALSTREEKVRQREDGEHLRIFHLMRDVSVETQRRGIDLDGWAERVDKQ